MLMVGIGAAPLILCLASCTAMRGAVRKGIVERTPNLAAEQAHFWSAFTDETKSQMSGPIFFAMMGPLLLQIRL